MQHPEYDEVIILVRKPLLLEHQKLSQIIIDFDRLDNYANLINGHALFCCLGSTRKKTPDLNIYKKIDHDYPVKLAELAFKNNMEQFHLVSAIGANAGASNFYTKMKGETEAHIKEVSLKSVHIYQPSLLTGDRKEFRLTERFATLLMKIIDPLLTGKLKRYRTIAAHTVAMAMYKLSLTNNEGVFTYPSEEIKQLA